MLRVNGRVAALGGAQCLLWGALYYAFGVVLDPMARSLGIERSIAVGAFSLGVGISALLAPVAARTFARGNALRSMRAASVVAVSMLAGWSAISSVAGLYAVWGVIGACMAFVLYEAAYAVVADAVPMAERQQAWMTVTLCGALASPIAVPAVHVLAERFGWRGAVLWATVGLATAVALLAVAPTAPRTQHVRSLRHRFALDGQARAALMLPAIGTATAAILGVLLFVDLLDRGVPATLAATVPATIGFAQIPGRLLASRAMRLDLRALTLASIALQAGGLVGLVAFQALTPLVLAAIAFGMGAGLNTLLKPLWFAAIAPDVDIHALNGRAAILQNGARAAAPFAAAWCAQALGGGLAGIGAVLAIALFGCGWLVVHALSPSSSSRLTVAP